MTELVPTRWGPVEITRLAGGPTSVLILPGGHCTAATDLGQDIYSELGYAVVTISRPGYGHTEVGPLSFAEFTPVVTDVCRQLNLVRIAAIVGISFGGQQAIHLAGSDLGQRLILHSCAPSTLSFPNTIQRILTPAAFGPGEAVTWAAIRRLVSTDRGLELMMSQLSTRPTAEWFDRWTIADRERARTTFETMRSGQGFRLDVRQGAEDLARYRLNYQRAVNVPTLITASRYDRGAPFPHATNLSRTIPAAELFETHADSHLYWLGATRQRLIDRVSTFLRS